LVVFVIYGAHSLVGRRFVERLLRADCEILVPIGEESLLREENELALRMGKGTLQEIPTNFKSSAMSNKSGNTQSFRSIAFGEKVNCDSVDMQVVSNNNGEKQVRLAKTQVLMHDLLLPQPSTYWGPQDIYSWLESLLSDSEIDYAYPTRYWLSIRDAIDGLFSLIALPELPTGVIDMCGRRAWQPEEVISELSVLTRRTNHAIEGNDQALFDAADLVPNSPLGQDSNLKTSSSHSSVSSGPTDPNLGRPDLTLLHSSLLQSQPEGWRPLAPFRVSIMEIIAHRLGK